MYYKQTILKAALRHREQNIVTYGIDLPIIDPWTSTPSIINGIIGLFDATKRINENAPAAAPTAAGGAVGQSVNVLINCIIRDTHIILSASSYNSRNA